MTLDGREGILAHVNLQGHPRIGKYGVDRATLETVGVGSIRARRFVAAHYGAPGASDRSGGRCAGRVGS